MKPAPVMQTAAHAVALSFAIMYAPGLVYPEAGLDALSYISDMIDNYLIALGKGAPGAFMRVALALAVAYGIYHGIRRLRESGRAREASALTIMATAFAIHIAILTLGHVLNYVGEGDLGLVLVLTLYFIFVALAIVYEIYIGVRWLLRKQRA